MAKEQLEPYTSHIHYFLMTVEISFEAPLK